MLHRAMASGVANLRNQARPEKNLEFSALQTIKKGSKHSELSMLYVGFCRVKIYL